MITAIYDLPTTMDRFTIVLDTMHNLTLRECVAIAENPSMFCQHSSCEVGDHLGTLIDFNDLPTKVKAKLKELNYC